MTKPQLAVRAIALLEILLAALLAIMCIGFIKQLLFPGANPPADQGGWAAFGFALFLPNCLAFAIAGITLLYSFRGRWAFQLLPLLAVGWLLLFFT
jgi:hypothetical protein